MQTFKEVLGCILLILGWISFQLSTGVSGNTIDIVSKSLLISAGIMLFGGGTFLFYSSGVDSAIGTLATINHMKIGLKYRVVSAAKTEADGKTIYFLLLETGNQIKAYKLAGEILEELSPGKCILKTADEKIIKAL